MKTFLVLAFTGVLMVLERQYIGTIMCVADYAAPCFVWHTAVNSLIILIIAFLWFRTTR